MTAAELLECRNVELISLVLKLRVKCGALATANHLLKTKINVFGVTADWKRVTEENKNKLLNAIRGAREVVSLKESLEILQISSSRFHNWMKRQKKCLLEDQKTCPKSSPTKLKNSEKNEIKRLSTSKEHAHFSIRSLALFALINGYVACSPTTWYRIIRENEWRRPRNREVTNQDINEFPRLSPIRIDRALDDFIKFNFGVCASK